MKKYIVFIVLLMCGVMTVNSCSRSQSRSFTNGNLRYAADMMMSKVSDFKKDGFQVHETYADTEVFSFIADFSGVKDFTGTILICDQNGDTKYFDAGTLGNSTFLINLPNYQMNDQFIIVCEQRNVIVKIEEFFPGITAPEEETYTSESMFIYQDEPYRVEEITKTFGYCMVRFDRESADPAGLNFTVYDHLLENKSAFFIDDYTMYLTDFMSLENCLYFKLPDNPNIFPVLINKGIE